MSRRRVPEFRRGFRPDRLLRSEETGTAPGPTIMYEIPLKRLDRSPTPRRSDRSSAPTDPNERPPSGDSPDDERPPTGDLPGDERPPTGDPPDDERPPSGDSPDDDRRAWERFRRNGCIEPGYADVIARELKACRERPASPPDGSA